MGRGANTTQARPPSSRRDFVISELDSFGVVEKDGLFWYTQAQKTLESSDIKKILKYIQGEIDQDVEALNRRIANRKPEDDKLLIGNIMDWIEVDNRLFQNANPDVKDIQHAANLKDKIESEVSSILGEPFSLSLDAAEQLISKHLQYGTNSAVCNYDRRQRVENRNLYIRNSRSGQQWETGMLMIARANPKLRVAASSIAGPGVKQNELEQHNITTGKRYIAHRYDVTLLNKVTEIALSRITASKKGEDGHIAFDDFNQIIGDVIKENKEKLDKSIKSDGPIKKSPYDAIYGLRSSPDIHLFEFKMSGHIGNKADQGEMHRLIKNTILLQMTYKGGRVVPMFACFERDKRFEASKDLPAGNSITGEGVFQTVAPGLDWRTDYLEQLPYANAKDKPAHIASCFTNLQIAISKVKRRENGHLFLNDKEDGFINNFFRSGR